jgi:RNA polymerase sigma factor (sigma-70 family)
MSDNPPPHPNPKNNKPVDDKAFPKTQWQLVLDYQANGELSEKALQVLCKAYWKPIFMQVRYRGWNKEDSEDLTQEFFKQIVKRDDFLNVSEEKGKLRTYLITALKNLMANEWRKRSAKRRGGGVAVVSIDEQMETYGSDLGLSDGSNPEKLYDVHWAVAVVERAKENMRAIFVKKDRESEFDVLIQVLATGSKEVSTKEIGEQLGMSSNSIGVKMFRFRRQLVQLMREEVLQTVSDPNASNEEFQYLMKLLGLQHLGGSPV